MGAIALAPYDSRWPHLYESEARRVARALTPIVATEHVGSTSVPGLAGKPTIDIAVGVETLGLPKGVWPRMKKLGYHYGGSHGRPQHIFRKGDSVPCRFLIHVVEYGGSMWLDFIHFRDYLRANPREAQRYAELKAALLAERGAWYSGADRSPSFGLSSTRAHRRRDRFFGRRRLGFAALSSTDQ